MPNGNQGSIHLFRLLGIDVFLHWSWFFVALYAINGRMGRRYPSLIWNVAEYLGLFLIVLIHEFGHALACRQVGGIANRIMLWPLGGVAYVQPPPRPGAVLWSIVAGPLVNVVLIIPSFFVYVTRSALQQAAPYTYELLSTLCLINLGLLAFNLLPIYPLDGGKILWALLWFVIGRARSLKVATVIGVIGAVGLIGAALYYQLLWTGVIAFYMLINCWAGLQQARLLSQYEEARIIDGHPVIDAVDPSQKN
jgi:Zn-dependent protease